MPYLPKSGSRLCGLAAALLLVTLYNVQAGSIVGSRHDLSFPSGDSDQVCAFCHTPHFANPGVPAPLWNRFIDEGKVYIPYSSPTMDSTPGSISGSGSQICLGCHDGTLGTGVVNLEMGTYSGSDKHDLVNAPGPDGIPDTTSNPRCERCHPEMYGTGTTAWFGTDLSNEHPIAITYPAASQDPELNPPPDPINGWPLVPLFDGRLECGTCHNVHDPDLLPFMRMSNAASQLCVNCHIK